ncbi:MFS transporter [Streptomyces sp. NPDC035033]|uniref:MFS transporter n=1 Tax=Streptomyces sp. NPDC035033 TaxID=3155368 RepID=UPI0033FEF6F7
MVSTTTPTQAASTALTARQWLILTVLCAAQFMVALDFSIVSVALPTIGDDLGFSMSALPWVVTAFALPSGGFLMVFGRAGDLYGRRRWFMSGLVLFTVASLVAGLAADPVVLLASRAAQGFAAAMLVPSGMSLLTTSFPEGPQRNRALGVNGALISLGFTSGVILGGVITEALNWRWTMFINIPFGLLAIIATPLLVAESRSEERSRLDIPGAVTVTAGLLALIYGITAAEHGGWSAPGTWVPLLAGVLLLILFVRIEAKSPAPLAPLKVLTKRSVGWGNLAGFITFSMITACVYLMTLYMQQVLTMNPLTTGLAFGSLGVAAILGGVVAPNLAKRYGARAVLVGGLAIQAIGTAALVWLTADDSFTLLLVGTGLAGFGHMAAVVAYTIVGTSGLADTEQGLASGLATTSQLVGLTVGIPVLGSIATARISSLGDSVSATQASLSGVHYGVLAAGAIIAFGALTSLLFLRGGRTPVQPLTAVTTDHRRSGTATEQQVPVDSVR